MSFKKGKSTADLAFVTKLRKQRTFQERKNASRSNFSVVFKKCDVLFIYPFRK